MLKIRRKQKLSKGAVLIVSGAKRAMRSFSVRMTTGLVEEISEAAKAEGASLNQVMVFGAEAAVVLKRFHSEHCAVVEAYRRERGLIHEGEVLPAILADWLDGRKRAR